VAGVAIVAVGAQLALQPPINSALGRHVGRLAASLVSFIVGTLFLFVLVLATGGLSGVGDLAGVPGYQLLGGLIGATYVATATLTALLAGRRAASGEAVRAVSEDW